MRIVDPSGAQIPHSVGDAPVSAGIGPEDEQVSLALDLPSDFHRLIPPGRQLACAALLERSDPRGPWRGARLLATEHILPFHIHPRSIGRRLGRFLGHGHLQPAFDWESDD
jgi:hypothetical protein